MITRDYTGRTHDWACPVDNCGRFPYRLLPEDDIPTLYVCGHYIGVYQHSRDDDHVRDEILDDNPTHLMIVDYHNGGNLEFYFKAPGVVLPLSNIRYIVIRVDDLFEYDGTTITVSRRRGHGTYRLQRLSPNAPYKVEACYNHINWLNKNGYFEPVEISDEEGSFVLTYARKESK